VPKPEHEFFRPDTLSWTPVTGSATGGAGGPGIDEKILARDADTGDTTRLLRMAPGVETSDTIAHDFWEEVWILEGAVTDVGQARTFEAGMYACRPPGMRHGPYRSARGCLMFEVRYFARPRKGG
jgi:ChrR-like protein with cupin domain